MFETNECLRLRSQINENEWKFKANISWLRFQTGEKHIYTVNQGEIAEEIPEELGRSVDAEVSEA